MRGLIVLTQSSWKTIVIVMLFDTGTLIGESVDEQSFHMIGMWYNWVYRPLLVTFTFNLHRRFGE